MDCLRVNTDLNTSCTVDLNNQFKCNGIVIRYADIDKSTIVFDECTSFFSLKANKRAYRISDKSFKPFEGSKTTAEKTTFTIFNDNVQFPLNSNDKTNVNIVHLLGRGEKLVFILEQENGGFDNNYQIFGLQNGLQLEQPTFDINGDVAWNIKLVDKNTIYPSLFFWKDDYQTTKDLIDGLFNNSHIGFDYTFNFPLAGGSNLGFNYRFNFKLAGTDYIFPFCAPANFNVWEQPVNIIDVYRNYDNNDKRYIFTLRDTVDKFALTQGESVVHGYELNGVKHEDTYNVPNCVLSIDLPIGNYSEIEVNSTIGFNDSGTIILTGNPLYTFDTLNKRQFTYTSKTETKFIGESQYLSQNSSSGYSVLNLINLFGINTYIIVCGNTDNVARVLDSYGSINNIHTPSYEWLYCGKNMSSIMGSNSGLGYGSIKYIHTELKNQLTYLPKNNDSSYYVFWNCPLAGTLKIQESMTHFGYVDEAEYNRAVVCNSNLITKVIIGENIISIVNGFGNGVARVDSLALIAPETAIISFSSTIKPELHIKPNATGYNVAPWTDTNIFSQIIQDL